MGNFIEIKREDSYEEIQKKLNNFFQNRLEDRKHSLNKFFGVLTLNEDPVQLQRRWRDE